MSQTASSAVEDQRNSTGNITFEVNLTALLYIYKYIVQILDETDWISHSTNTFGKGMNPIILSPAMSK